MRLQLHASGTGKIPAKCLRHKRGTGCRGFGETRCDCGLMLLVAAHPALKERALEKVETQPCPGGTRVLAWLNTFHPHWFFRV